MDNVKIKVETSSSKFINYLINNNIEYKELIKNESNYILITEYDNYKKINRRYNTNIIRYYGIKYIKEFILKHKYMLISFAFSMFILLLLTNTIYNIEINCDNENLKQEIKLNLEKHNIKKYKRIKTYEELEIIKEKLMNNIKELEWIEITRIGTKYVIDITPKLIKENSTPINDNDIIASKDGVIKHIIVHNGEKIKEENEYVKKGEVIISGNIYQNEELVNTVDAKGEVYAEVWYLSKIEVPLKYKEKIKSDKTINHIYIELFSKKITLIGQYKKEGLSSKITCILDKPYLPFKLYKETLTKYEEKEIILTTQEALDKGLKLSEIKLKNTLNDEEYIISKNVLKKSLESSKMYIEVFFKVYENIGLASKRNEKEIVNEERNS